MRQARPILKNRAKSCCANSVAGMVEDCPAPYSQTGFTLVELVVTLIIVGIIAAYVVPRFFGTHGFEERGFHDETLSALRYAQKAAIAQRRQVCVALTDQTATLTIASANPGACNVPLAGPDGVAPYVVDANASTKYRNAEVKFSAYPTSVTFDPLGRPGAAASIQVAGHSKTITVEVETGYVH